MAKQIIKGTQHSLTILDDGGCLIEEGLQMKQEAIKRKLGFDSWGKEKESFARQFSFDSPTIDKKGLVSKPDDFLLFPFRLISATLVGGGTWKSTDFSNQDVLRAAMPLLEGKPAYMNHYIAVGEEIGTIGKCEWVGAKAVNGDNGPMVIPAGIDGPYVLDSVLQDKLCRKLMYPVSPIQSSSVTVVFDWESSHEFEDEYDFYYHVGEMLDGREVTRVVTNITNFIESSLVYLGADQFAKMKDKDGKYITIDRPAILSNAKTDEDPLFKIYQDKNKFFAINSFSKENSIDLKNAYLQSLKEQRNQNNDDDMEFKKHVAALLSCSEAEVTDEKLKDLFGKAAKFDSVSSDLAAEKKKVTDLETSHTASLAKVTDEVTELKKTNGELTTTNEGLKLHADLGKKYIDGLKEQAKLAYSKTVDGKTDPVIDKEIDECTSVESLSAKIKLFGGKLVSDFSASCTSCGSKEISYRSSEPDGKDDNKKQDRVNHLSDLID